MQRVQSIAMLVRYASSEQRQRVQSLRFNRLLRGAPTLGDITQNHGVANLLVLPIQQTLRARACRGLLVDLLASFPVLNHQRHDIKIYEAICRIENFHVATDWSAALRDRKSTRLNSSHVEISYAVFCLKKK